MLFKDVSSSKPCVLQHKLRVLLVHRWISSHGFNSQSKSVLSDLACNLNYLLSPLADFVESPAPTSIHKRTNTSCRTFSRLAFLTRIFVGIRPECNFHNSGQTLNATPIFNTKCALIISYSFSSPFFQNICTQRHTVDLTHDQPILCLACSHPKLLLAT